MNLRAVLAPIGGSAWLFVAAATIIADNIGLIEFARRHGLGKRARSVR